MERRFPPSYLTALIAAPVAAGLRLWTLFAALDENDLPTMHLSMVVLIAVSGAFLLLALALSLLSPGRSGQYRVMQYGKGGASCAMAAALLIGLGAVTEFMEALREGASMSAPILTLLGMGACICLFVAAGDRRQDRKRHEAAEVLPVAYLLIKLILNFKSWSTDPIILDYCFKLFAMIFALLAFFLEAGFVFDRGKPRRTLFCAMGAVFFCAAAIPEGMMNFCLSETLFAAGFLLWQLPAIWDLPRPSAPDPSPEKADGGNP